MNTLRIAVASITLLMIGLELGCDGFFVDPVLTGIAVGPAATIQTADTLQMSALGTYDDGKQKTLKSGVFWNSGTLSVAKVSESGLATGVGPGQSVITGSAGTVSARATVTVTLGNLTSIKVTSSDGFTSIPWGSSEQFVATGTAGGQHVEHTEPRKGESQATPLQYRSTECDTRLLNTTTSG